MNKSDYKGLPDNTKQIVDKLEDLGFDRERIFGLFVLIGLFAGAPRTQEEIESIFSKLQLSLPIDRSKNIDEEIGDVYCGYDLEINEFCYRSGADFDFKEITVPHIDFSSTIVKLRDEKILATKVKNVKSMIDAHHLSDAFIVALGKKSLSSEHNLLEAYQCGIFQIQLHTLYDVNGSRHIAELFRLYLSIFYNECFIAIVYAEAETFLQLLPEQIPLFNLTRAMDYDYALEFWAFQSRLFYKNKNLLDGIEGLSSKDWHKWVINIAEEFDKSFSNLISFSKSNITLTDLPVWGGSIKSFQDCNNYINKVWGYSEKKIKGFTQILEYKALMTHVIYSSLTSSREIKH